MFKVVSDFYFEKYRKKNPSEIFSCEKYIFFFFLKDRIRIHGYCLRVRQTKTRCDRL